MYDSAWGKLLLLACLFFAQKSTQFHFIPRSFVRSFCLLTPGNGSRQEILTKFSWKCNCFYRVLCKRSSFGNFVVLVVGILFDLSATKMSNSKLNVFERVLAFVLCKHVITFEFIFWLLMMRGRRGVDNKSREVEIRSETRGGEVAKGYT